jgi:uncharacterized delta-60 repeat protein
MQRTTNVSVHNRSKRKQALLALALMFTPALIYAQTPSGTLDTSFGLGGKVTIDFATSGIVVQPDGRLVVAGALATPDHNLNFAVARFNSDGAFDSSFGTGGKVGTDVGGQHQYATSLALQADGKIVVAGGAVNGWFNDFVVGRYNSDGTLDSAFGSGGAVTTQFGVSAQAYSVAVQPDGKIVVAGDANIDGGYNFELVRYNGDGTLDAGFGTGGRVTTDFGLREQGFSYAQGYSLAVQPDGKLVVAGQAYISRGFDGGFDAALARYNSNGTLDTTFGNGGKVTTDLGGRNDWLTSVAVLPDGRIVAAGQADVARGAGFALARYNGDGTLDTSFGTGGTVTTDFFLDEQGFSLAQSSTLAVLPDERIVVGGRAYNVSNEGFHYALARYNLDGTLDGSFGAGGKVTDSFGRDYEQVRSLAVQQDGKIVTAGVGAVARYK